MKQQQTTGSQARLPLKGGFDARRILLVDDSVDGREVLAEFLKLKGHWVCEAGDGIEALIAASKFRPEIAFLDICMPRMDGFELCARLRANRLTQDAAVFALTAGSCDGQIPAGALGMFDAYLRKPVELDVVDGLINGTTAKKIDPK